MIIINDDDDVDDDLPPMPVESEEVDYTCWFQAFQFNCATKWKYIANWKQYNQIYIVWFCFNGSLYGLEWLCMSHNFLASRS